MGRTATRLAAKQRQAWESHGGNRSAEPFSALRQADVCRRRGRRPFTLLQRSWHGVSEIYLVEARRFEPATALRNAVLRVVKSSIAARSRPASQQRPLTSSRARWHGWHAAAAAKAGEAVSTRQPSHETERHCAPTAGSSRVRHAMRDRRENMRQTGTVASNCPPVAAFAAFAAHDAMLSVSRHREAVIVLSVSHGRARRWPSHDASAGHTRWRLQAGWRR